MTDDRDDEYLKHNIMLSAIGATTAMVRLTQYTRDVDDRASRLVQNPDAALTHTGEIRAISAGMISDLELLKSSLDRYINAFEDIHCMDPPPLERRRRAGGLTRRRFI